MEKERVQKYISECGIMSRRAAEAAIDRGEITIDGRKAKPGDIIDPSKQLVAIKGKSLPMRKKSAVQKKIYIALYKPRGYVTTSRDELGRKTVLELLDGVEERVYPIGRLDIRSEGLLLLTNDGELTNKLTHPSHEIPKVYHVVVNGIPTPEALQKLNRPMKVDDYIIRSSKVDLIKEKEDKSTLRFSLTEGRNRQIRKMLEAVDMEVLRLKRVAIGDVIIGTMRAGEWRELTPKEITYLKRDET